MMRKGIFRKQEGPVSGQFLTQESGPSPEGEDLTMTEKVLLVDDEKDFLETLADRMRNRGMTVDTSASAIEALKRIETESYDAIILDLMMPGMDGLEALKRVKERRPELQVILLTGFGTLEKGIEAMKLGATDFVEKPADLEILTQKIKNAQAKKMILVEKQTEEKIRKIMKQKPW
jgi:DNA-binding NtrC family response regulator